MAPHIPDGDSDHESAASVEWVDYGDVEQYYRQSAVKVAVELFGEDFSRSGVLYSTDRDGYIPYRIVCSDGQLMTYNMLHGTDTPAGGQGLNGYIVSRQEAEQLAHEKLG